MANFLPLVQHGNKLGVYYNLSVVFDVPKENQHDNARKAGCTLGYLRYGIRKLKYRLALYFDLIL